MSRETVAMALCLSCVPALVLTLSGFAPFALPAWCAGWCVLVLTKEKTR